MQANTAEIIDLNSIRRSRAKGPTAAAAAPLQASVPCMPVMVMMPVVFYVPVVPFGA